MPSRRARASLLIYIPATCRAFLFAFPAAKIGLFYYGTPHRSKPIIFLLNDKNAKYNPPTSPMYCREELYPTVRAKGGLPGAKQCPCVQAETGGQAWFLIGATVS